MKRTRIHQQEASKTTANASAVKAVISWLIESDREFRATQSMVNEAQKRF